MFFLGKNSIVMEKFTENDMNCPHWLYYNQYHSWWWLGDCSRLVLAAIHVTGAFFLAGLSAKIVEFLSLGWNTSLQKYNNEHIAFRGEVHITSSILLYNSILFELNWFYKFFMELWLQNRIPRKKPATLRTTNRLTAF